VGVKLINELFGKKGHTVFTHQNLNGSIGYHIHTEFNGLNHSIELHDEAVKELIKFFQDYLILKETQRKNIDWNAQRGISIPVDKDTLKEE